MAQLELLPALVLTLHLVFVNNLIDGLTPTLNPDILYLKPTAQLRSTCDGFTLEPKLSQQNECKYRKPCAWEFPTLRLYIHSAANKEALVRMQAGIL